MLVSLCKSKIHRATVSDSNLHYEGSLSVSLDLLEASQILPYEKVSIVNVNNGARFDTYAIPEDKNSGKVVLNGAAARCGQVNDIIIIMSYALYEREKVPKDYSPHLVYVNEKNQIKSTKLGKYE